MTEKILLSWSGGKDSALSLHELRKTGQFEITALVTTVTEGYDRISMHGVRRTLLEQQAASAGIALEQIVISQKASNQEYEMAWASIETPASFLIACKDLRIPFHRVRFSPHLCIRKCPKRCEIGYLGQQPTISDSRGSPGHSGAPTKQHKPSDHWATWPQKL